MRTFVLTLACAVALAPGTLRAQGVGDDLTGLAQDNAELYVQPLFEGLGQAMGTGFLRSPNVHGRLGFDIGVRLMLATFPDAKKTYTPVLPATITVTLPGGSRTFTNPYTVQGGPAPTAAGGGSTTSLVPTGAFLDSLNAYGIAPSTYDLALPGGLDIPAMPFAAITAGFGIGFGTEITLRGLPDVSLGDVTDFGAFGFGVTHRINQWIPNPIPVDLAVFGGRQSVHLGDYLDMSSLALGASVGKGLGPLSVYAIAQYGSPSATVQYTVDNPGNANPALPADGTTISFEPTLDSGVRTGVGAQLSLLLLHFAGEYTTGDYNAYTVRVSLGIR